MTRFVHKGLLLLCVLSAIVAPTRAAGPVRTFMVAGRTTFFTDVTGETSVGFASMRFNRAQGAWNVELTVRNQSPVPLRLPLVVAVTGAKGTSGALHSDNGPRRPPREPSFWDVSSWVSGPTLGAGAITRPRTLSFGRIGNEVPKVDIRVYAATDRPPGDSLALAGVLNHQGVPIPGATVLEDGPAGSRELRTDGVAGIVTLGGIQGDYRWQFSASGYHPAWRRETLVGEQTRLLPTPRLVPESATAIGVTAAASSHAIGDGLEIAVPAQGFAGPGQFRVSLVDEQSLPFPLPAGWSPQRSWWIGFTREPARGLTVRARPQDSLEPGRPVAVVQLDAERLEWRVVSVAEGRGFDPITFELAAPGAYVVATADRAPAPPAPSVGGDLAGIEAALPPGVALAATGEVRPAVALATTNGALVTAEARIKIDAGTNAIPSGTTLRAHVVESYLLTTGTRWTPLPYDAFVTLYQRPGATNPSPVMPLARFPLRPVHLLGPATLAAAEIRAQVETPELGQGGRLGGSNATVVVGGMVLRADADAMDGVQAVGFRPLMTRGGDDFSDEVQAIASLLTPEPPGSAVPEASQSPASNPVPIAGFELLAGGIQPGHPLRFQFTATPPAAEYLLARAWYQAPGAGLEPVCRYSSRGGAWTDLDSPPRGGLSGITTSGQYVLFRNEVALAAIEGLVVDGTGVPVPGLVAGIEGQPWRTLTDAGGRFRLAAPTGTWRLTLADPGNREVSVVPVRVGDSVQPVKVDVTWAGSPLTVSSVDPQPGSTGVAPLATITLAFNRPVAALPANAAAAAQLIPASGAPVDVQLRWSNDRTRLQVLPSTELAELTRYTVVLSPHLADAAGRRLSGVTEFPFTTLSRPFERGRAGQLISEAPGTNGMARVIGSPGMAEPRRPVLLVNDTTGQTVTVTSGGDGSFAESIPASIDDRLRVVLVGQDGSRSTIPVGRQLFPDGSVALFSGGGRITNSGPDLAVVLDVPAGAILGRTRFQVRPLDRAELERRVAEVPPEHGTALGAFDFDVDGDPVRAKVRIEVALDLSRIPVPPGRSLEDIPVLATARRDVDESAVGGSRSVPAYEFLSLMERTPLPTPPSQSRARAANAAFIGYYALMDPVGARAMLVGNVFYSRTPISGLTQSALFRGGLDYYPGTELPVGGAVVRARARASLNPRPFTLQPGELYATSDQDGSFSFLVPSQPMEGGHALNATHPAFPGQLASGGSAGTRFDPNHPYGGGKILFDRSRPPDSKPPSITITHAPTLPAPGTVTRIRVDAVDESGPALATLDVESTDPPGALATLAQSGPVLWELRCNRKAKVVLRARATDPVGNAADRIHIVLYGEAQPPPAPLLDPLGPRVVASQPDMDSVGVSTLATVTLQFSEWITPDVLTAAQTYLTLRPAAGPAHVTYGRTPRELVLRYPLLAHGTEYTLTVAGLRDLTGQVLDQDPSTNSPPQEPFVLRFRTAPEVHGTLAGITDGGGTVVLGSYAYVIDRNDPSPAIPTGSTVRRYDISIPARPVLRGEHALPGPPRAITLVRNYEYTLDFASPGHPSQAPGPSQRGDLLVIAGKTFGAALGYLRIYELGGPFETAPAIGAANISLDETSLLTRLSWSAPYLALIENSASAPQVHLFHLQGLLLGDAYRKAAPEVLSGLPESSEPGLDLNADGDFVDRGDRLPLIGRDRIQFPPGEEDTLTLNPNRRGLQGLYFLQESSRFMADVVVDGPSRFVGLLTSPGRDRVVEALAYPIVTNDFHRPAAFRSFVIGQSSPDTLLPPVVADAFAVEFPGWYPKQALLIHAGLQRLALINLVSLTNAENAVRLIDVSRPDFITPVGEIPLPAAEYGLIQGASLNELGQVVLSTVTGTSGDLIVLDPALLLAPVRPGVPHPAILGRLSGAGAGNTPSASTASGVSVASLRNRNVTTQTSPLVRFLPPGTNAFALLSSATLEDRGAELLALPEPDDLPVAGQGTNAALPPTNPVFLWHLLVAAPGGAGRQIQLTVLSLDAANQLLVSTSGIPAFHTALPLRRVSDDPGKDTFNLYVSEPLVLVDDSLPGTELVRLRSLATPLLAGSRVRVGISEALRSNPVLGPYAGTGLPSVSPPPNAPPIRLGVSQSRPIVIQNPELGADDALWLQTSVDAINARTCPGSVFLNFHQNLDADISITMDGSPLRNAPDENGTPIAEWTDVRLTAGHHRVLIDSAHVREPGEHRFEVRARRFEGLAPARELTVAGTLEHEIEIQHSLPVGHTIIQGVDLWDGHLTQSRQDVLIPGRKLPIDFSRTYSSSGDSREGPMGAGWTHSYHVRLVHRLACGVFVVIGGEGSGNAFTDPSTNALKSALFGPLLPASLNPAELEFLRPQIGYHSTLVRDPRHPDTLWFFSMQGVRYTFTTAGSLSTPSETTYTLREIREPNGNSLVFNYLANDTDPVTLDTVTETDTFGIPKRGLALSYQDIAGSPRVVRLTAFNEQTGSTLDGLEVLYRYDTWGNLTNVVRPGRTPDETRSESYVYTPGNGKTGHNLVAFTDPNGAVTRFAYAAAATGTAPYYLSGGALLPGLPPHEIITNITHVGVARPGYRATTDQSYGFRYDFPNFARYVADPRATDGDGQPIPETQYTLNAYGATVRIAGPLGQETLLRWATDHLDGSVLNEAGQPVRDVVMTWRRDAEGQEQFFDYHDGRGNLTRERTVFSPGKAPVTDRQGQPVSEISTLVAYDPVFNQRTNSVDPEGAITSFRIDPRTGNLLATIDAENHATEYRYHPTGDLKERIDPRGHVTRIPDYDPYGNPRRSIDPLGNESLTTYDERSRLVDVVDGFGRHQRFTYDALDRRISEERLGDRSGISSGPDSRTGTRYLPAGQVQASTNALGLVTTYRFDALNREIETELRDILQADGSSVTYTNRVEYDAGGNLVAETDGRGVTRTHAYDALNRRTRTAIHGPYGGPSVPGGILARLAYDRVGNVTNETDLHNLPTSHRHDGLYRVVETQLPFPGAILRTGYDRAGSKRLETDANGHATWFAYDRLYRKIGETNAENQVTLFDYDPANNLTNVHHLTSGLRVVTGFDPLNRESHRILLGPGLPTAGYASSVQYEDRLNQTVQVNTRGFKTRTRRDGLDRVAEVVIDTDNLALTNRYTHDASGNVLTVSDPENGDIDVTHTYDQLGRRLRSRWVSTPDDSGEVVDRVSLDAGGNILHSIDRRGTESRFTFDNLNRPLVTELREALSNGGAWLPLTRREYDDAANAETTFDARGNPTLKVRDELQRPRRVTDVLRHASILEYDGVNLRATTDALGRRTEYTYDRLHRPLRTAEFGTNATAQTVTSVEYRDTQRAVVTTDPRGLRTVVEKDALDRPIRTLRSGGDLAARYGRDPLITEERGFDASGNLVRVTDGDGRVTEHRYDGADRRIETTTGAGSPVAGTRTFTLDKVGNAIGIKDARVHGGAADLRQTFDARYRLVAIENALGEITRFHHDAEDHRIEQQDPLGWITRYEYDELGALVAVDESGRAVAGDAGITRFRFDENRNLVAVQDADGNLVTAAFDALNRPTNRLQHTRPGTLGPGAGRRDATGGGAPLVWSYRHDPGHRPSGLTDPRGQRVEFRYDHRDRLTDRIYTDHAERIGANPAAFQPLRIHYDYDANGNPTNVVETKQGLAGTVVESTTTRFDALDRPVERVRHAFDDPAGRRLEYAYDVAGNRTRRAVSGGRLTTYTFDERHRLRHVVSDAAAAALTTIYSWLPDDLLERIDYPGGARSVRAYDAADRLTGLTNTAPGGSILSAFAYRYDAHGNRVEETQLHPALSPAARQTRYEYDRLDRLTRIDNGPGLAVRYAYSKNGNRVSETGHDPVTGAALQRQFLYTALPNRPGTTYNGVNTLTRIEDLLVPAQSVDFEYDPNLNQVARIEGQTRRAFRFDIRDQMILADTDSGITRFDYSHQRRRLRKVHADIETRYLDDDGAVVGEYGDAAAAHALRVQYEGGGGLLGRGVNGPAGMAFEYYLTDALGSVADLVDAQGVALQHYQYDPWGRVAAQSGPGTNPRQFTGHYRDAETGLHYFGARYYDDEQARFLSQDPREGQPAEPRSLHRYLYAFGNPHRFTDPTGFESESSDPADKFIKEARAQLAHLDQKIRADVEATGGKEALAKLDAGARAEFDLQRMGEEHRRMLAETGLTDADLANPVMADRAKWGLALLRRDLGNWAADDTSLFPDVVRAAAAATIDTAATLLAAPLETGAAAGTVAGKLQVGAEVTTAEWIAAAGDVASVAGDLAVVGKIGVTALAESAAKTAASRAARGAVIKEARNTIGQAAADATRIIDAAPKRLAIERQAMAFARKAADEEITMVARVAPVDQTRILTQDYLRIAHSPGKGLKGLRSELANSTVRVGELSPEGIRALNGSKSTAIGFVEPKYPEVLRVDKTLDAPTKDLVIGHEWLHSKKIRDAGKDAWSARYRTPVGTFREELHADIIGIRHEIAESQRLGRVEKSADRILFEREGIQGLARQIINNYDLPAGEILERYPKIFLLK